MYNFLYLYFSNKILIGDFLVLSFTSLIFSTEVTVMMRAFYIHIVIACIGILTSKVTFLILILSYIWMGYTTNTELIFYVLSIFHQLTLSFGIYIPINISKVAEFRAAFIRLNKLLQSGEIQQHEENLSGKPSIYLKDVTVHIKEKEILSSVNLKVTDPSLTLVTGAVGSGKSSLLKAILQDYPRSKGKKFNVSKNYDL